jgi:integrase
MEKPLPKKRKIFEDFLEFLSPGTKRTYTYVLWKYFDYLKSNPDEYLNSVRDFNRDIMVFAQAHNKVSWKSQQLFLAVLKQFFLHYDVELKPSVWKKATRLNHISSKTVCIDFVPNNMDLRKVLVHCNSLKERCLFVFSSVSGIRIDECLQLELSDIDWKNRHVHIRAEISKTKTERDTFFTPEAEELLNEWLKVRSKFIIDAIKISNYARTRWEKEGITLVRTDLKDSNGEVIKKTNGKTIAVWTGTKDGELYDIASHEKRLFPFSYGNAEGIHITMINKAGAPFNELNKSERLQKKRYRFHIHCYRKFCETSLANTPINKNHLQAMVGHQSQLERIYERFPVEELKKSYDKNMYALAIFTGEKEFQEKVIPELETHKTTIASLMQEIAEMKLVMDSQSRLIDQIMEKKIKQQKEDELISEEARDAEFAWQEKIKGS